MQVTLQPNSPTAVVATPPGALEVLPFNSSRKPLDQGKSTWRLSSLASERILVGNTFNGL